MHFIQCAVCGDTGLGRGAHRRTGADGLRHIDVEPPAAPGCPPVSEQVRQLDDFLVSCQPPLHRLALVHTRAVRDEGRFPASAFGFAHQRLPEPAAPLVAERAVDNGPIGPARVGDGGARRRPLARAARSHGRHAA